jgi:RNA polymerase sigma-70 factor (ECF subfamily)
MKRAEVPVDPADIAAFTRRLEAMRPRLHRYCARMTGSVIDGEDVVQETMIKALGAFKRSGEIANVDAWLFRIAHNTALDHLRRRKRENALMSTKSADLVADPHVSAESRYAAAASLLTFMQLSPAERGSVILMDVLGYSLDEIGTVFDASLASVKASLHRGRERLREMNDDHRPARKIRELDAPERRLLVTYIEKFNARDFDALRTMLADDVRLDLVALHKVDGKAAVGNYFQRYSDRTDWRLMPGLVEGRPAILVFEPDGGRPVYFVLVGGSEGSIATIRDFRYARYVMDGAEVMIP